jgi:hypothetical protein
MDIGVVECMSRDVPFWIENERLPKPVEDQEVERADASQPQGRGGGKGDLLTSNLPAMHETNLRFFSGIA